MGHLREYQIGVAPMMGYLTRPMMGSLSVSGARPRSKRKSADLICGSTANVITSTAPEVGDLRTG
jgi:hypothetical protein